MFLLLQYVLSQLVEEEAPPLALVADIALIMLGLLYVIYKVS